MTWCEVSSALGVSLDGLRVSFRGQQKSERLEAGISGRHGSVQAVIQLWMRKGLP